MEQAEKEDAAGAATKKSAKPGLKNKKKMLAEACPSPMGRRVEPAIDAALKAKYATAAAKKKKAEVRITHFTGRSVFH